MEPNGTNQGLTPPFELSDDARREYILLRVRGAPVPPRPAFERGEEPHHLIASWIMDSSVSWANDMREDPRALLQEALTNVNQEMADTGCWELGGLLALAAQVRDDECGKAVSSFVEGEGSEALSAGFMAIENRDCLYGDLGSLMFRVIDMTSPPGDVALFEAGIGVLSSARGAASLLTYLARRNPTRAEDLAEEVVQRCHSEADQDTLVYTIRLLREACWGRDDNKALLEVRHRFIGESHDFRKCNSSPARTFVILSEAKNLLRGVNRC